MYFIMKKLFTALFLLLPFSVMAQSPCTTANGAGCLCPDGSTNCDLYPDLTVSQLLLEDNYYQPETRGMLRVSIATPNIGYGPLNVKASDYYVCGTDTTYSPFTNVDTCPDGSSPRQLIKQQVYHKDGDGMSSYNRWAGSMTYHPTHFHMHVDAWCSFSLRHRDETEPDPLKWPIAAEGAKLGFCLMDYGTCDYYDGYCVDNDGGVRNSSNQVNYGLGGGEYSCGLDQGISVGFTDIYHYWLDDMDMTIPADVCNGDYYLVVMVDPNNNFVETDETNNVMAIPFVLNNQNYKPEEIIDINGVTTFCKGDALELTAKHGSSYLWSTGETTETIQVTQSGNYTVQSNTLCGEVASAPIAVTVNDVTPTAINDTLCHAGTATLGVQIPESTIIKWYDTPDATEPIAEGSTYTTEVAESKTYYVRNEMFYPGEVNFNEPHDDTFGLGGYNSLSNNGYEIFDVFKTCELVSVKVRTQEEGERTIQVRSADGTVLQERTVLVPVGESRVQLNFMLEPGTGYQLIAAQHPRFYRNNSGVTYPYSVDGYLSITASNYDAPDQGNYYYYYYYDWEVKQPDRTCISEAVPVTAFVAECVGTNDVVLPTTFTVSPNPSNGSFSLYLQLPKMQNLNLRLTDAAGSVVYAKQLLNAVGNVTENIKLATQLPAGMYMLQVVTNDKTYTQKVVVNK